MQIKGAMRYHTAVQLKQFQKIIPSAYIWETTDPQIQDSNKY